MQGKINVRCNGCEKLLTTQLFDSADVEIDWQEKIQFMTKILLRHRKDCPFYGKEEK